MRNQSMKIIQTLLILLTGVLAIAHPAMSAKSYDTANPNNVESDSLAIKQDNALNRTRILLEKAFDSYQQKDIKQTKEYLRNATELLNESSLNSKTEKVKLESKKLAQEIENFYHKISLSSELHENKLARFWHQTTSIIKRETDQLIHRYNKLYIAEKTLKHLLDAKMHLFTAKHDLFVSHNEEDAIEELSEAIDYLDKAEQVAILPIKSKVESLRKDIQSMKNAKTPTASSWKQNEILISLDVAFTNLNEAKRNAAPTLKLRIETLQHEIDKLRKSIDFDNLKNDYDSATTRLITIIHEL